MTKNLDNMRLQNFIKNSKLKIVKLNGMYLVSPLSKVGIDKMAKPRKWCNTYAEAVEFVIKHPHLQNIKLRRQTPKVKK